MINESKYRAPIRPPDSEIKEVSALVEQIEISSSSEQIQSIDSGDGGYSLAALPHLVLEKITHYLPSQELATLSLSREINTKLLELSNQSNPAYHVQKAKMQEEREKFLVGNYADLSPTYFGDKQKYLYHLTINSGFYKNFYQNNADDAAAAFEKFQPFFDNENGIKMLCELISYGIEIKVLQFSPSHRNSFNFIRQLILKITDKKPSLFTALPESLKNHLGLCQFLVRNNPKVYDYFTDDIKLNLLVVMTLLRCDPLKLKDLPMRLQNNSAVALEAVSQNGLVLEHALPAHRANEDIVKAAMMNNPLAYKFASQELKHNISIARFALSFSSYTSGYNQELLDFMPKEIRAQLSRR